MNTFIVSISLIFSTIFSGTAPATSEASASDPSAIIASVETGGSQSETTALSAQDTLMQIVNTSEVPEPAEAEESISSNFSTDSILMDDTVSVGVKKESDVTLDDFFVAETGEDLDTALNASSKLSVRL